MLFIESAHFTKLLPDYKADDDYREMQVHLSRQPEAGDLIRASGGLRKLRWGTSGRGKRGGVRVIYYWRVDAERIYLMALYAKNEVEDLSPRDFVNCGNLCKGG